MRSSSFGRTAFTFGTLFLGVATCSAATSRAGEAAQEPSTRAAAGRAPLAQDPPSLMVLLVVDQLRADLITRYQDLFTGGFKRLLEQGRAYTNASHYHAHTETAAGHATLATGAYPSRHGIVSNNWTEEFSDGLRNVYAVEDLESEIVGIEGWEGRSPANLRRDGLADWVLAHDEDARVLSVSTKDRAAIPMGGRNPEANVYWIALGARGFVTSSYYRDRYPAWVSRFDADVMPGMFRDSVWASSVPREQEGRSRPDSAAYEGDSVHVTFPHIYLEEADTTDPAAFEAWTGRTPFVDRMTLAFVSEGIDELELGQRGATDFLAVSFSQTDYVGHDYGPLSREQMDNLLRLDGVLYDFLAMLDDKVGEGRWVLAFSSDHGTLDAPEWRAQQRLPGYRSTRQDLRELSALINDAVRGGGTPVEVRRRMAEAAEQHRIIERAYLHEDILAENPPDSFAVLFENSFWRGRNAGILSRFGIEVRGPEGTLMGAVPRGSSHLGPYWYDRFVPLAFLGAGVTPGWVDEPVHTVDLAPTLMELAGIESPGDLSGRSLGR